MGKIKLEDAKTSLLIIVLIGIILIFGTILTLQITGVIKPTPPKTNSLDSTNISNASTNTTTNREEVVRENRTVESIATRYQAIERITWAIVIGIIIVEIGLNIGICKLYKKLGLPSYIIVFNFIWPILNIINNYLPSGIKNLNSIICGILGIVSLGYYFKAVGMSSLWAVLPFGISLISVLLGIVGAFFRNSSIAGIIMLVGLVTFIIAYIISNLRLAKIFNKGTGFTIGLALLPFIFQPILGYQKEDEHFILNF